MTTARTVRRDELDELLDLYRTLNPDDPVLDREAVEPVWDELLADETVEVVVIEHDDRLVATCLLSITRNLTRGARPFAVIENVVTHEDYRGEGFGKRVIDAAVDLAGEWDCYKVMLLTGTNEEWKLQFYEDCGFDRAEKTGFVRTLEE